MNRITSPLDRAVRTNSGGVAVVCGHRRLTYRELDDRCRRLAGGLAGLGLGVGDRVAVVGSNCHRYLELYLTVPSMGCVLVPLNQRHTDAELGYALSDSGTRVLFTDRRSDASAADVETTLTLTDDLDSLVDSSSPVDLPEIETSAIAGLFYTGGTTGVAKGVMLTHRNLVANAMHFLACWRFESGTRWLIMAPMFHAAGTIAVLATTWAGGTQVILPTFDPAAALDLIEKEGVTATLAVPTMLAALADEQLDRPRDVTSLRYISHGGAPIATETLRRTHQAFPQAELLHIYGTTETAPIATLLPHEERLLDEPQARSCGQPAIGVDVVVLDPESAEVRTAGEVGEVAIRGDNVMAGYWNKPETTAQALRDGWYWTGDLGYMDERGFLYLVDRAKDMIVTGAENVYSTEVEEALYAHPAVLEAAVFAVPDGAWGEAVHAVVVPRHEVTEDELKGHCRERIAGYKVPKRIELRTEPLPKSGAGKILKRELRALTGKAATSKWRVDEASALTTPPARDRQRSSTVSWGVAGLVWRFRNRRSGEE